jgi:hypothetical protein
VKAQIRREGRVKLSEVAAREIAAMAEARLLEDVEYLAKLIAEAKAVVERWQWGPRGGQFAKACGARRSIERMSCTEWSGEMIVGRHVKTFSVGGHAVLYA